MKGKKILITGGAGFIGSHLAEALARENRVVVADKKKRRPRMPPKNVAYWTMDVLGRRFLERAMRARFDYIFHLAGNVDLNVAFKRPAYDFKENVVATFALLEALRRAHHRPRLIFTSSAAVYRGSAKTSLKEDTSLTRPVSTYGAAKLAGERYLDAYARLYGVPAITLRLFPTYGPRLRRQIVYDFIRKLDQNPAELLIIGDGTQERDIVFVGDQVASIVRVAERAQYKGEVYNLCSGKSHTTVGIAKAVVRAMKLKPRFVFTKKTRAFDAQRWVGDPTKIKKLGCRYRTSLEEGVRRTVAWYRAAAR